MSACPQCGTPANQGDKFCSTCGALFSAPGGPGAAPAGGGGGGNPPGHLAQTQQAPPQQASPYGAYTPPPAPAPAARCQLGHEIPPGQSYCPLGHPIALDAMQFTGDLYAAPPGYGQPPPGPQQPQQGQPPPPNPYAAPPGQAGYPPQTGYPPGPQGYPPQPQGYPGYPSPSPGYPAPGAPPGYPAPQGYPSPQGYAPPQGYPSPQGPQSPTGGDYGQQQQPAAMPSPAQLPPNALRGFLVSYQLNPAGDFWPLRGGRMTVGRVSANDQLDIPLADATISSRHATLTIDGASGSIVVDDIGSTNGTYVNDEHLGFNGRRELRDGDILRFGGFQTLVKIVGGQ